MVLLDGSDTIAIISTRRRRLGGEANDGERRTGRIDSLPIFNNSPPQLGLLSVTQRLVLPVNRQGWDSDQLPDRPIPTRRKAAAAPTAGPIIGRPQSRPYR